ncbi:MAG TPA: alanine--tRNA ligase [Bacillota bacterium]|nr:alanine--tRNA ligase [Bacillota bacterium]
MKTDELRQAYLRFFESKGHKILPSAPLVPAGDPTLLLTAAGMVPFKPYFLGTAVPEHTRVTTCQKCVRTGDIDNVGKTTRHGTFFEMLGNFSFGDYFKAEAIPWAWEFVTDVLGLAPENLWVTIYLDDDEAFNIWRDVVGVSADRIIRKGKKDNFWEIGVGPCGPCSEIHIDRGADVGCGSPECGLDCDCGRFIELWNLVFIQYHKDEDGNYTPLERPGIDTGMGLERVAAVLQGAETIFDTDETRAVRDRAAQLACVEYGADHQSDVAIRVITDHVRAAAFMVADGIFPTNEGRGYVLRRLLRRAARYGRLVGIDGSFLPQVADTVIDVMAAPYPELARDRDRILKAIALEEDRFAAALEQGSVVLESIIAEVERDGGRMLPGEDAFKLYDTYGFPFELTEEIASERGLQVDKAHFDEAMEAQRERARAARGENAYLDEKSAKYHDAIGDLTTEFVGYHEFADTANIIAIIGKDGNSLAELSEDQDGETVMNKTPFYPTGGGQQADTGLIVSSRGAVAEVCSVSRPFESVITHQVHMIRGTLKVGDRVIAYVDEDRRAATMRNHTATHLIQAALRQVLGEHVQQAGSYVDGERLRFDFSHFEALTVDELAQVELLANRWVMADIPVDVRMTTIDEAHRLGAIALFDEKYGDEVRMVGIGDISLELCGGTHVSRTGEIGLVKIVSESGIAAGVRRIEAITGYAFLQRFNDMDREFQSLAEILKVPEDMMVERVEKLLGELKEKEREIARLRERLAVGGVDSLVAGRIMVDDIPVVAAPVELADPEALRNLADAVRDKLGSGIVLLGSKAEEKVLFVATVSRDLVKQGFNAGSIVREAAKVAGGGGGGRPDMAQAGGRDVSKLEAAIEAGVDVVRAHSAS